MITVQLLALFVVFLVGVGGAIVLRLDTGVRRGDSQLALGKTSTDICFFYVGQATETEANVRCLERRSVPLGTTTTPLLHGALSKDAVRSQRVLAACI
jgi:hypothetical protein